MQNLTRCEVSVIQFLSAHVVTFFAADSIWVYPHISVVSSEIRMTSIAECVMTVQGHPRSMIFVSV